MNLTPKAKGQTGEKSVQKVYLPHNSCFVLGWETNRRYLHGISRDARPNSVKKPAEVAYGGERISLTFRTIATFIRPDGTLYGQGAPQDLMLVEATNEWDCFSILSSPRTTPSKIESPVRSIGRPRGFNTTKGLISAFSAENKDPAFDWDRYYGGGFGVLNIRTTPVVPFGHVLLSSLIWKLEDAERHQMRKTRQVDVANASEHSSTSCNSATEVETMAICELDERSYEATNVMICWEMKVDYVKSIREAAVDTPGISSGVDKRSVGFEWALMICTEPGKYELVGTGSSFESSAEFPALRSCGSDISVVCSGDSGSGSGSGENAYDKKHFVYPDADVAYANDDGLFHDDREVFRKKGEGKKKREKVPRDQLWATLKFLLPKLHIDDQIMLSAQVILATDSVVPSNPPEDGPLIIPVAIDQSPSTSINNYTVKSANVRFSYDL